MTANLPPLNLIVQVGPDTGKIFAFKGQVQTIGRGSINDIIVPDQSLSRQHAKIQVTSSGYIIEDLGSTNGTFVNECRVQGTAPIRPGDTLRLGNVTFGLQPQAGALDHGETIVSAPPAAANGPDATTLRPGKSAAAPDATFVPQTPPAPIQPQQKSSAGAWAWVGVAILIALLIVGGTLGYIYYTTQPPAVPTEEVAQATPTSVPPDTPEPSATPPPEATPTPEPINVPGVAAASARQQMLSPDVVEIDPFCQTEIEVAASEAIAIKWAHPLAEANYLDDWLAAAHYDLTLDGRPINTFNYFQDEDGSLVLWHELGLLEPGTHFVRIQWFTDQQITSGMDLDPVDGQMDLFGPGPIGEGSCEIVVAEPIAAATSTPTTEPTEEPTVTPSPSPTTAQATLSPPAPLGIFQDFERPSTWKRGDQPYGDFSRTSAQVHSGSYAGQLNYNFPGADNDYVVFQQMRRLAGRPNAISAWVYGDGTGHFLNVWIKDANGQSWAMSFGQVEHTGWQEMTAFLDPGQPWPSGHISGPDNGAIDYPISFQALVLDDGNDNFSGRGTIYIDDLNSQEGYTPPLPTPTPAPQVGVPGGNQTGGGATVSDYLLQLGAQHRYEEPWGAPIGGNPCRAWENNDWDDKNANFRGFNVELIFTNNSTIKVPDDWGESMRFFTAGGQEVTACYYGYNGAGPAPGGSTSLTFFSVVPKGDYVQTMQLNLNGQFVQLCLDGRGGWSRC